MNKVFRAFLVFINSCVTLLLLKGYIGKFVLLFNLSKNNASELEKFIIAFVIAVLTEFLYWLLSIIRPVIEVNYFDERGQKLVDIKFDGKTPLDTYPKDLIVEVSVKYSKLGKFLLGNGSYILLKLNPSIGNFENTNGYSVSGNIKNTKYGLLLFFTKDFDCSKVVTSKKIRLTLQCYGEGNAEIQAKLHSSGIGKLIPNFCNYATKKVNVRSGT